MEAVQFACQRYSSACWRLELGDVFKGSLLLLVGQERKQGSIYSNN